MSCTGTAYKRSKCDNRTTESNRGPMEMWKVSINAGRRAESIVRDRARGGVIAMNSSLRTVSNLVLTHFSGNLTRIACPQCIDRMCAPDFGVNGFQVSGDLHEAADIAG